ncbi:5-(carboxyamino)imidazole ribonucleotide synthase [Methylobacterium haplocladii]|uniref:N5-carboxyaminoimidazole ribonucleotide synthase n=1 Tax=Methylobacterium haplocladii TaxID=1176176 RepID=A0A512IRX4_9HYPH|nr:5-(carboxyamino)imidazole ribonucleotide synthase [Methylobacterium haplocladii]GEP00462.1 N5-carboxyaminoimidazole ribonucleotide synthase [Methylobacterium haplocladii]GJD82517.1 N5-carboxyaminoimidazole ribonucleotide synthase [Methylobacterium haplocladii]GLS59601.1 N5-carboxyaminoimidazole ribonucleotide synthase [Methylobacterium haplocladii]
MTNSKKAGPVRPGGTIGILGGGQLGRMIALAAANYGLKVHVYAPDADSPAFDVAAAKTVAPYEDPQALAAFADSVDVVTYEFENIPHATAEILAQHATLHPNPRALLTTQDRLAEKRFVNGLGIPTAPFQAVDTAEDLADALDALGRPAVLKTRRFGYDGKGQRMIRDGDDAAALLAEFGGAPCILEGFVPFEREISVVAARGTDGAFAAYDPCANEHADHILALTRVPAPGLARATSDAAIAIAKKIAEALDYVGVLAVELFEVAGPAGAARLVVNEIAPRVHNSGHWTIEGATTSQFAQSVRAVCGWPLGDASRVGGLDVEMRNLIGDTVDDWPKILAEPGAHLHLYGKGDARPGRKMGHVTRLIRRRDS